MKNIKEKVFSTSRLSLGHLTDEDAAFIFALTNSDGWIKFIGDRNIKNNIDAKAYISKVNSNPEVKYWKVSKKEDDVDIGLITLIKRDYLEDLDIGFAFLSDYAKKGYAFEATKVVLDEVLPLTESQRICAITQVDNSNSIRLLKKLGLTYDRVIKEKEKDLYVYTIALIP